MIKYFHIFLGVVLILGGIGYADVNAIFYVCGIIFAAAGLGELCIGE